MHLLSLKNRVDGFMCSVWTWLRDPKNLAVMTAIGGVVAFSWAIFDPGGAPPATEEIPSPAVQIVDPPGRTFLTEEQMRAQITNALHGAKADRAISILRVFADGAAKREECERVFAFCIKNRKLLEAETVVNVCWDGKRRDEAFAHIEQEGLK